MLLPGQDARHLSRRRPDARAHKSISTAYRFSSTDAAAPIKTHAGANSNNATTDGTAPHAPADDAAVAETDAHAVPEMIIEDVEAKSRRVSGSDHPFTRGAKAKLEKVRLEVSRAAERRRRAGR